MTTTIGDMRVFSNTTYISIDDPYGVKQPVDDRMKGKQFSISVPKEGELNETYFGPFQRLYESEPYVDHYVFKDEAKKNGFLSSSAAARDEFSLTRRAAQYKEALKKEESAKKAFNAAHGVTNCDPAVVNATMGLRLSHVAEHFHAPELTFDVSRVSQATEPCARCRKNMHRCPHKVAALLSEVDNFDPLRSRTTYNSYGSQVSTTPAGNAHTVSTHAHRPIIATSFYRTQGVFPAK